VRVQRLAQEAVGLELLTVIAPDVLPTVVS
jgi:hypothetical protein